MNVKFRRWIVILPAMTDQERHAYHEHPGEPPTILAEAWAADGARPGRARTTRPRFGRRRLRPSDTDLLTDRDEIPPRERIRLRRLLVGAIVALIAAPAGTAAALDAAYSTPAPRADLR